MRTTGFINWIFGKALSSVQGATHVQLLNSYDNTFTPYDGNAWGVAQVRTAVHAFARHASKVSPRHIRRGGGTFEEVSSGLNRLLRTRPNPYMTASEMYYKIAASFKLTNNAFIYPVWQGGKIVALHPVLASRITLVKYQNELFCAMDFAGGKRHYVPYCELIHIRSHFFSHDIFGDNNDALAGILETSEAFNQSMRKFAMLISVIRGLLQFKASSKNEDLKARRDEFVRDNLRMTENDSGIIVTDAKYDYKPVDEKYTPIPAAQLAHVKGQIYEYFGVSVPIVQNTFTEEEWNAFYEGELEPFFILLTQALTNGAFTEREQGHGNEINAAADRLRYASVTSKNMVVNTLSNIGVLTVDQALTIFDLSPIGGEEGARRVQSLNYASTKIVDSYQGGKQEEEDKNADG